MSYPNVAALARNLRSYFVGHGEYYGVDPAWHDHSKLVASDGAPDPALSVDASGYISAAVQPLFSAYNSVIDNNVTGDGTWYYIICDTEIIDRNGDYNVVTGTLLAPVDCMCLLVANIDLRNIGAAHTRVTVEFVTSNRSYIASYENGANVVSAAGPFMRNISIIADMDAGDTARVRVGVFNGAKIVDVSVETWFQGYLLI